MKRIFTLIFALLATFAGAQARNVITLVEATSPDIETIPVMGKPLTKPTFNVTTGSPAFFNVNGLNGWWQKRITHYKNMDEVDYYEWKDQTEGTFTPVYIEWSDDWIYEPYRFECQVRINNTQYVLAENVKVRVNGEEWETYDYWISQEDGYSLVWVRSPQYLPKCNEFHLIELTSSNLTTIPQVGARTDKFPSFDYPDECPYRLFYEDMAWEKLVDGEWEEPSEFTPGTWRLRVGIRELEFWEGMESAMYKLASDLKLKVNGVEWETSYVYGWFSFSPTFTLGTDDPRTKISLVEATSEDLMTIPVMTMPLTKPTFTVTTGSPAYFNVNSSNGWWHKRGVEQDPDDYLSYYYKWVQVREGNFTYGYEAFGEPAVVPYHFKCQLRIQSDEYVVDKNVTVMVNGEKWTTEGYIDWPEDGVSFIWVTSPDIYPKKYEIDVVEATGPDVATFPQMGESTNKSPTYEIDKYYWCSYYTSWQKLVDGEWQEPSEFTPGTWRLKVGLSFDMQGEEYATYTIADCPRLIVNGVEWEREIGNAWHVYYSPTFTLVDGPQSGTLGTQGMWWFADGVLTVDYVGQMPWDCTSKTTDPEVAYRLKWIHLLSQIKEIVITGADVEIQPYFLYYSGDGDLGQHPDDHVRTLTLGSGVKKVGKQALALYDLKRVNSYGIDPPVLASDLGESNCFWKRRIQENQAFLYLPKNAGVGYAMINSEWAYFNHSTNHLDPADDPVGIKRVTEDTERTEDTETLGGWYSLDGRKLSGKPTQKGIYVNSGKKVLVK